MTEKSNSSKSSQDNPNQSPDEQRQQRVELLKSRVSDLIALEPELMAIALADLAIATLAQKYPASLTDVDKAKIKRSFPPATEILMQELAMSEKGVSVAVKMAVKLAKTAIDYTPIAHWVDDLQADSKNSNEAQYPLENMHSQVFKDAVESGLSPFGVLTTLVFQSVRQAKKYGVHPLKITRPLIEGCWLASSVSLE